MAKSPERNQNQPAAGSRRFTSAHTDTPATHVLCNGRYAVMVTAAGSGYSRWKDISVTRWREDATCDDWGSYIFIRDVRSGKIWSAGYQPVAREPDAYSVEFNEDRADFARQDGRLETALRVIVSAEDDAEVRRVTITNSDSVAREVEITSYAELVLAPQAADVAHPAFSKLFVETEYVEGLGVILATRRPRQPDEQKIWAAHLAMVDGKTIGEPEVETDRARFLGRSASLRSAAAMTDGAALSGTVGTVLDPIFALRQRLRVAPGATATIAFWTMVAESREAVLSLVDKHRDAESFGRAATLASTQARVQMHHLGIDQSEAAMFQRLAGHILFATPELRSPSDRIRDGAGGKSRLWKHGISGDLPIVLLRISEAGQMNVAHQLLQSAEYWRLKMLNADLVILNECDPAHVQDLQDAIETHARTIHPRLQDGAEGSADKVFFLRADLISADERDLLVSVARVVLDAARGQLSDQLDRISGADVLAPPGPKPGSGRQDLLPVLHPPEVELFNGLGGFANDGRAYVAILGPGQSTPAPWINIISNRTFGFQVATEGSGYTWAGNSHENQLTPWSNDPVADRSGESFYLRDEDTGEVWSPTAHPVRVSDRLALLFTPPFDMTDMEPGYIKGYPPGVRENGGQYSHAAMWSIIAFTKLGEGDKAAALFSLLNPINHARTPAEVERYKVEPYVVAADVYSMPPHVGRGGWTWYTGSAGWMYRAGIENIIGLQVQAGRLRLDPCIPKAWPSFRVALRHRSARYEILVENPDGVSSGIVSALVDGIAMAHRSLCLPLVDDGTTHQVLVRLG